MEAGELLCAVTEGNDLYPLGLVAVADAGAEAGPGLPGWLVFTSMVSVSTRAMKAVSMPCMALFLVLYAASERHSLNELHIHW